MGHIALYREWRPRTFDEIVEQRYTVAALKQAVISGKIANAYLFSGTRGTGKTTMAQVFSRAINCLHPVNGNPCNVCSVCTGILNGSVLDVIEMDAASNNSVDNIRRLCDEIVFIPSVTRYKVYIIDEVHMLSTGAFNALLKTLEEPPAHAVFILATTEQHRIPATILSRCQRYEFHRIPVESIVARLRKIADADGISINDDALMTIARLSDGALRDAISLLDQAKGSFRNMIEKEDVLSLVGVVNDEFMNSMALAIANGDPAKAMQLVDRFILDGRDVIRFTMDLAAYFRNIMICHVTKNPEELIFAPSKTIGDLKELASFMSLESVLEMIRQLSALISDLKWSLNTRTTFEIALIRFMSSSVGNSNSIKSDMPLKRTKAIIQEKAGTLTEDPKVEDPKDECQAMTEPPEEFSGNPAVVNVVNIDAIWPEILDSFIAKGQMTVYLFLLPATPVLESDRIYIKFKEKDRLNYNELSSKQNHQLITQAVAESAGSNYEVVLGMQSEEPVKAAKEAEAKATNTPAADVLRKSAEELGISFYMEE